MTTLKPVTYIGEEFRDFFDDRPSTIEVVNDWQRLGAETYICIFRAAVSGATRKLIAKACIKPAPSSSMGEWIARRTRLSCFGIETPELIAVNKATLVEEYIEYDIRTAYNRASREGRELLLDRVGETACRVIEAGFRPHAPFFDLRSRGNDVVIVDYGEDLGHFYTDRSETVDPQRFSMAHTAFVRDGR